MLLNVLLLRDEGLYEVLVLALELVLMLEQE